MPINKIRRGLKLEWAIYLREFENRVFGGTNLQANELNHHQLPLAETEFQSLLAKTKHRHWAVRERAAKDLGMFHHPDTPGLLILLLKDERPDVRWAAMNSLIGLRRTAVRPLLEELTRDFQSSCFVKAARRILDELNRSGELTSAEIRVLNSLINTKKGLAVAQAANEALILGGTVPV